MLHSLFITRPSSWFFCPHVDQLVASSALWFKENHCTFVKWKNGFNFKGFPLQLLLQSSEGKISWEKKNVNEAMIPTGIRPYFHCCHCSSAAPPWYFKQLSGQLELNVLHRWFACRQKNQSLVPSFHLVHICIFRSTGITENLWILKKLEIIL